MTCKIRAAQLSRFLQLNWATDRDRRKWDYSWKVSKFCPINKFEWKKGPGTFKRRNRLQLSRHRHSSLLDPSKNLKSLKRMQWFVHHKLIPCIKFRLTIKLTLAILPLTCLLLLACNQASLTGERFQSERSIAEEFLRGTNNKIR